MGTGTGAPSEGGWLEREGECDKMGWGKCLPIGVTKTEISFGGKNEFYNIGEFIKNIYNYSLIAIQILAVVVIIIAGAQWASSAGNAETIGKAKKRIVGAVIGMTIALMSYVIMNTINPATVKFRLPQVYMIREQVLPSKWCREMSPETLFAYAIDGQHQSDKIEATGKETGLVSYANSKPTSFWCGQRFFIGGGMPEQFCWGDRCAKGQICTDIDRTEEKNPYMCRKGSLGGTIFAGGDVSTDSIIEDEDDAWVILACKNGKGIEVADKPQTTINEDRGELGYMFAISDEDIDDAIQECGGEAQTYGFVIAMDFSVNNVSFLYEAHLIGDGGKDVGYIEYSDGFFAGMKQDTFIPISAVRTGKKIDVQGKNIKMCSTASYLISGTVDHLGAVWKLIPGTSGSGVDALSANSDKNIKYIYNCIFSNYLEYYEPAIQAKLKAFVDSLK